MCVPMWGCVFYKGSREYAQRTRLLPSSPFSPFSQNVVQSSYSLYPSESPSVLAKPATACFLSVNLNTPLVVMCVNSCSFFLNFHSFFNYQFQCCMSWNISSLLGGLKWELPPLCSHSTQCILLWWPAVHQNPWAWLSPEGSFWRHRSHSLFLCIIGAMPVFGVAVDVL